MEISIQTNLSSLNQFHTPGHYELSSSDLWSGIYNLRDNKIHCNVVQSPEISNVIVQFKTPYKYSAIEQHQIASRNNKSNQLEPAAYHSSTLDDKSFVIQSTHGWITLDICDMVNDTLSTYLDNTHTLVMKDLSQLSDVDVQNIQKIYIPPHITSLPDGFLSDAINLKNIYFDVDPDRSQLTSIGASAFCNCQQLEILQLPNSVLSIGEYAFNDVRNIKSVLFGTEHIVSYDPSTSFQTVNPYNTYIDQQFDVAMICANADIETSPQLFSAIRHSSHVHSFKKGKLHYADLEAVATKLSVTTIEQREMTWEYNSANILSAILIDAYSKCSELWQSIADGIESVFMNQDNVRTRSEHDAQQQAQDTANTITKAIKDNIQHHNDQLDDVNVNVIQDYVSGRCTNVQMIGHGIKLLGGSLPEGDQDSWTVVIENSIKEQIQRFANALINSSEITTDDIQNDILCVIRGKLTSKGEVNLWSCVARLIGLANDILSMLDPSILTAFELIRSTRIRGYHVNSNVVGTLTYDYTPTVHRQYNCVGN